MKTASEAKVSQINAAQKGEPLEGTDRTMPSHLRTVENAFVQAQQRRNDADYNLAKEWTPVEANTHIASVKEAFDSWNIVREEADAQAYLVSLLGPKERRANEPKTPNARPERKPPPTV
jgi:hypothetical protein